MRIVILLAYVIYRLEKRAHYKACKIFQINQIYISFMSIS
jgi:hypothetical protein